MAAGASGEGPWVVEWPQSFSFARWQWLLEMGGGGTTAWIYLIPPNCTLEKWLRWFFFFF